MKNDAGKNRIFYIYFIQFKGAIVYIGFLRNPDTTLESCIREAKSKKDSYSLFQKFIRFLISSNQIHNLTISYTSAGYTSSSNSEGVRDRYIMEHQSTVLNEDYGNGIHLKMQVDLKKELLKLDLTSQIEAFWQNYISMILDI